MASLTGPTGSSNFLDRELQKITGKKPILGPAVPAQPSFLDRELQRAVSKTSTIGPTGPVGKAPSNFLDKEISKLGYTGPVANPSIKLFEPTLMLSEQVDAARKAGVPADQLERALTGRGNMYPGPGGSQVEATIGIEDWFYKALESGPAQKFFGIPLVAKGLKGVDLYSQYTQRSIVSGIKELTDLVPKKILGIPTGRGILFGTKDEASWEEFKSQAADPKYGWGTAFPLNSKEIFNFENSAGLGAANKWIDRIAGGSGDIITAPETFFSGVGGIIKQGVLRGALGLSGDAGQMAAKRAAIAAEQTIIREAAEKGVVKTAVETAEEASQKIIADATKNKVPNVTRIDALAAEKARLLILREEAILAKEAADQAAQTTAARVTAGGTTNATTTTAAKSAAADVAAINSKIDVVNSQLSKIAPPKSFGRANNMSIAQDALRVVEGAKATLKTGEYAGGAATKAQLALAQKVVDLIDSKLINELAQFGLRPLASKANKEAAQLFGANFGLKVGIPGTYRQLAIPGTEYITRALSSPFGSKFGIKGLVRTPLGAKLIQGFIPMRSKGILTNSNVIKLRTAFTSGRYIDDFGKATKLTPEQAIDLLNIATLADNNAKLFAVALTQLTSEAGPAYIRAKDAGVWAKLSPYLMTPESSWVKNKLSRKNLTDAENKILEDLIIAIKKVEDQSDSFARSVGVIPYARTGAFLPTVQSDDFVRWAEKNPAGVKKIVDDINKFAEQTANFPGSQYFEKITAEELIYGNINRRLQVGQIWFGTQLTADDIAGGAARLNAIARNKIKLDVFSPDAETGFLRFIDRSARYQAYVSAMGDFVSDGGELAYKAVMEEATRKPAYINSLYGLEQRASTFLNPDSIVDWNPGSLAKLETMIEEVTQKLDAPVIQRADIEAAVSNIDEYVALVGRAARDGSVSPAAGIVTVGEAQLLSNQILDELAKIKQVFKQTDVDKWRDTVPAMIQAGFDVIDQRVPTMAANSRNEIAQMLININKVATDRTLLASFNEFFDKLFVFTKTYQTSTVGFHSRNAQSNVFLMMLAGADPRFLKEGLNILGEWRKAQKAGESLYDFADRIARRQTEMPNLPKGDPSQSKQIAEELVEEKSNRIIEALTTGSRGEVGQLQASLGAGQKVGVTGLPARGIGPRGSAIQRGTQKASEIAAYIPFVSFGSIIPPAVSRKLGNFIEENTRFLLTYDGLMQGLNIDQATARTNRFLIDYSDLSALDKVGQQVFPYYTFMARNLPMQLTSVWTNPRLYAYYNEARQTLGEDETTEFFPRDWRKRGLYKMAGDNPFVFKFDLGIPQTTPTPISQTFAQTFASSNPLVKSVIEAYVFGESSFTGAPIVKGELGKEGIQKAAYVMRNVISPASGSARQIRLLTSLLGQESPIATAFASDWANILFGTKEITEEDKNLLNQFIAVAAYSGLPLTAINDDIKLREIWKAYFEVKDITDTQNAINKKIEEEARQRIITGVKP